VAKLFDLARMTTATTGTGTITLGAAASGSLNFAAAGVRDGDVVSYGIADGANSEVGTGIYTSSGTTLTRNVSKSTNSNSPIPLSGAAQVFVTARAEDFGGPSPPGGRLTLTSGAAIMQADVAGGTTIYYTPAVNQWCPIYDGVSAFVMTNLGGELSQATTDSTKSPAAVVNNSNYDIFVWMDGPTPRATRGPAWTSDTARGTGAGTTELQIIQGIATNKNAITNGPGANLGTYVGTVRSNGSASVDMKFGTSAVGGGMATLGVWNLFNQVNVRAKVQDSTANWSLTSATIRSANNSNNNRVNFVIGLQEHCVRARYAAWVNLTNNAGAFVDVGLGLDTTSSFLDTQSRSAAAPANGAADTPSSDYTYAGLLGFHFVQALEKSDGVNSNQFAGGSPQNLFLDTWM